MVLAFCVAFAVLVLAEVAKGHRWWPEAAGFAAPWGAILAAFFAATGWLRLRAYPACAACRGAPEADAPAHRPNQ